MNQTKDSSEKTFAEGLTVWITGISGSGKTTLGVMLSKKLKSLNYKTVILDGDTVRTNLWNDLDFTKEGRAENIRRITYLAKHISDNGVIAVVSCISPYREFRDNARKSIKNFVEVHAKRPIESCVKKDVKQLYKKAMKNEIPNFTGISSPYEDPINPEVLVESDKEEIEGGVDKIINKLKELGYIE